MRNFDELLKQLEADDNNQPWTGPDGLMYQGAEAIRYLLRFISAHEELAEYKRQKAAKKANDE